LYAFGLVKCGGVKQLGLNWGSKAVVGLDADGDVYMAKFDTIPV